MIHTLTVHGVYSSIHNHTDTLLLSHLAPCQRCAHVLHHSPQWTCPRRRLLRLATCACADNKAVALQNGIECALLNTGMRAAGQADALRTCVAVGYGRFEWGSQGVVHGTLHSDVVAHFVQHSLPSRWGCLQLCYVYCYVLILVYGK